MGALLGSGLAFPLRVDARGGLALAHEDEDVREAIQVILGTAPGERPMRPEFGCGIHDHVFDGASTDTAAVIAREVEDSLRRWEPRVDVDEVVVTPDADNPALLHIDIRYSPVSTNDPRNLVFPFYTIPAEEVR